MSFLQVVGSLACPVDICQGRASIRTGLRVHFVHRRMRYTVVIVEEGNLPHPRCNILVPLTALNGRHLNMSLFSKLAESNLRRLPVEEVRAFTETVFWAYGRPLTIVAAFKYLGRILPSTYNNWTVVVSNLRKARKKWAQMSRILGR